jgi:allantoicase
VADHFRMLPDLAGRALGGSVMYASDEFFGDAHSLIAAQPADHDPGTFGRRGKVYDGWETRRRREPGTDFVIVRLAAPALVVGVVIDTAHFRGNFPPFASVAATTILGYPAAGELRSARWVSLIDRARLAGDTANVLPLTALPAAGAGLPELPGLPGLPGLPVPPRLATHVRLTIEPDGGVARFRVHGEVVPDPRLLGGRVDLAAAVSGGRVVSCSNMFYAAPGNVLAPGRAAVMSDGWETARRRDDGNDWLVVELAAPGVLHDVVIDTSRFVGNAPGWAELTDDLTGAVLLRRTALLPDTEQRFRVRPAGEVSRVRLDIYPDGGISRLRLNGAVAPGARDAVIERWLGLLPADQADRVDRAEFFD